MPDDELLAPIRQILEDLVLAIEDGPFAVVENVVGCVLQGAVELARSRGGRGEVVVEREEELQGSRSISFSERMMRGHGTRRTASLPHSAHFSLIHLALTPARTSLTTPPTPAVAAVV